MKMIYPCKSEKKLFFDAKMIENNLNMQKTAVIIDVLNSIKDKNVKRALLKTQTLNLKRSDYYSKIDSLYHSRTKSCNKNKKIKDLQKLLAKNFLTIRRIGNSMELVPGNTPKNLNSPIPPVTDTTNDSDSNLSSISLNDFNIPADLMNTSDITSDDDTSENSFDYLKLKENEPKIDEQTCKVEKVLNLIIHRLPGEKLGMGLKVEDNGTVIVNSVLKDSAADRASDVFGYTVPIRAKDNILEINGVSLKNLNKDEISLILSEIPLYLALTISRFETSSPLPISNGNKILSKSPMIDHLKIPIGYSLHTVYLSSLESKCVMPNDLKETNDFEGFYRICRGTLQIGEEDHLQKGDILISINGEELNLKNKFDIISKLSGLSGIAEVAVLRKSNVNCYVSSGDEIPYYNGIFAQNSIKLAMRRYEKPAQTNSDAELKLAYVDDKIQQKFIDEKSTKLCNDCHSKSQLQPQENWIFMGKSVNRDEKQNEIAAHNDNNDKTSPRNSFGQTDGERGSLTCSSCHSDRSQVQINLVCCEPIITNTATNEEECCSALKLSNNCSLNTSNGSNGLTFISTSSSNTEIVDNIKSYISTYKVDLYYPLVESKLQMKINADTLKIEKRTKSLSIGKTSVDAVPSPPADLQVRDNEVNELLSDLLDEVEKTQKNQVVKEDDEKRFEEQQGEIYEELANLQSTAIEEPIPEFLPQIEVDQLNTPKKQFYSLNLTKLGNVIDLKNHMQKELIGLVQDKSKSLSLGKSKLTKMIERIQKFNKNEENEKECVNEELTSLLLAPLTRSKSMFDTSTIEPISLQEQLKFELSRYSSVNELLKEQTLRKTQSQSIKSTSKQDQSYHETLYPHSINNINETINYVDSAIDKQSKLDSGISEISSGNDTTSGCDNKVPLSSVKEKVLLFQKNRKNSFNLKKKPKSLVIDNNQSKIIKNNVTNKQTQQQKEAINKAIDIPNVEIIPKREEPKKDSNLAKTILQDPSRTQFRSVKDKIAYFSSQTNKKQSIAQTTNQSINANKKDNLSKLNHKKESAAIEEILQKNVMIYDSLQNAYKSSLVNTLKSVSKSNPNLDKISPSNTSMKHTLVTAKPYNQLKNDTRSELKNIFCSNENKISNLIKKFAN